MKILTDYFGWIDVILKDFCINRDYSHLCRYYKHDAENGNLSILPFIVMGVDYIDLYYDSINNIAYATV